MEILDIPLGFQSWLGSHLMHKNTKYKQCITHTNTARFFLFLSTQLFFTKRRLVYSQGAEDCGVDLDKLDPNRMEISLIFSRSPLSSASRYSFWACNFVTSGKKSLWMIFSKLYQKQTREKPKFSSLNKTKHQASSDYVVNRSTCGVRYLNVLLFIEDFSL